MFSTLQNYMETKIRTKAPCQMQYFGGMPDYLACEISMCISLISKLVIPMPWYKALRFKQLICVSFLYVVRDQALFIERNYRYSFVSKYTMDLCDRPRHLFDVIHK